MHWFNVKTVLFQTIQFSISTQFKCQKTAPFPTNQSSISIQFSSSWSIDRTLSGANSPGQSGPGSDSNEGILWILQSSSITGTDPSDCFKGFRTIVSRTILGMGLTPLQRSSRRILQPQLTGQCRICGDRDETVNHISGCYKLRQKEYKNRYDWVGKVIHWELCKKLKFHHTNKWYMHKAESVLENGMYKIFRDFEIQSFNSG